MAKVKIQENSQIKLFCKIPIIQGLKKDFKFQRVLWASISHISLPRVTSYLSQFMIFLEDGLPVPLGKYIKA